MNDVFIEKNLFWNYFIEIKIYYTKFRLLSHGINLLIALF